MKGQILKHLLGTALAASLAISASTAYAGGPIIIDEEVEVVPQKAGSSMGILPIILVTIALCAALCDRDEETGR